MFIYRTEPKTGDYVVIVQNLKLVIMFIYRTEP